MQTINILNLKQFKIIYIMDKKICRYCDNYFKDQILLEKHQKSSKKLDLLDTSAKEPDLYVLVTVDEGVALPPDIINHYKPVFVQPKKATVELWDAITKKQLLLCTFSRFWGGIGSYDYCRETLVKELKRALDELKTKEKLAAPTPQPTVEVIP